MAINTNILMHIVPQPLICTTEIIPFEQISFFPPFRTSMFLKECHSYNNQEEPRINMFKSSISYPPTPTHSQTPPPPIHTGLWIYESDCPMI